MRQPKESGRLQVRTGTVEGCALGAFGKQSISYAKSGYRTREAIVEGETTKAGLGGLCVR